MDSSPALSRAEKQILDKGLKIFAQLLACEILKEQAIGNGQGYTSQVTTNDRDDQRRRGKYAVCSN